MRLLSQHNDVIWINYHASRRPRLNFLDLKMIANRLRQSAGGTRVVEGKIKVLAPLLLPFPEVRWARDLNARRIARHVRRALADLPKREIQLWLFTPDAPELIDLLNPDRVLYYCVDDFAGFSGFNPDLIARFELATCSAADLVLATSEKLLDKCRPMNPNCHLLLHGVDYDHFASTSRVHACEIPSDVREIPRPIFGYFGLISDYVDLDLIAAAARARPEWSFVLLGERNCDVSELTGIPNIHLLGSKPYEHLPLYCRAFDVGLIPFRMNRLTRAVNPIKLREYLAAGLPVVSAPMPEVLRYAPAVRTAETLSEFIETAEASLQDARRGDPDARRTLVCQESWRARVETISRILTESPMVSAAESTADQPRPSQSRKRIKAMA